MSMTNTTFTRQVTNVLSSWLQPVNDFIYYNVLNVRRDGAAGNGTTDDTTAIQALLSSGRNEVFLPAGTYLFSTLTVPAGVTLSGVGFTSATSAATKLLRTTGSGIVMSGDDSCLRNLLVEGNSVSGDNITITGSRTTMQRVTSRGAGNDGVRIGITSASPVSINANLWRIDNLISIANGRDGLRIDDTNSTTSGTFPLGTPNVNGGTLTHADLRSNGGNGLTIGNAIDCCFVNAVIQTNTLYGVRMTTSARGHNFYKLYTESNTSGEVLCDSGAKYNLLMGSRSTVNTSGWTDSDGTNLFLQNTLNPPAGYFWSGGQTMPTVYHSGGMAPPTATTGTDSTPVVTETYICEVFVEQTCTITGVSILNGSLVAGNIHVGLASATGAALIASASVAASGAAGYQQVPFSAPFLTKGPAKYFILLQCNNTGYRFRTHAVGNFGGSKKTGETYGTFTTITPPTTFTAASLPPIADLY